MLQLAVTYFFGLEPKPMSKQKHIELGQRPPKLQYSTRLLILLAVSPPERIPVSNGVSLNSFLPTSSTNPGLDLRYCPPISRLALAPPATGAQPSLLTVPAGSAMANGKKKIKRTKTFTGCWTCRSRKVKCGQEKPACLRCRNALLPCEGYQAALTWPDSERTKGVQRMAVLDHSSGRHLHAMSRGALWSALTALDSVPLETSLSIGLFGVFPMSRNSPVGTETEPMKVCSTSTHLCSSNISTEEPGENENAIFKSSSINQELTRIESHPFKTQKLKNSKEYAGSSSIIRSREGRQLMHYWITYLSPLMLPVPSDENPFQTLMIPLALSAAEPTQDSAGPSTLLYSLYAVAAISQENRRSGQTKQHGVLSAKYLQFSFQYLRRSLSEPNPDHPEAILSAIIMLLITSIFNEQATDWRVHLRGAFTWLKAVAKSSWKQTRNASIIYEIFLSIEALRPAQPALALELEPWNLGPHSADTDTAREPYQPMTSVFGITQPSPASSDSTASSRAEDPAQRPAANAWLGTDGARASGASACLHRPRGDVPVLQPCAPRVAVGECATPSPAGYQLLDEIMRLEAGQNVSGLLWPAFITGCEADEAYSRGRIEAYFDDREALGIGNVMEARTVIREVWQRRDKVNGLVDVKWHEVMVDLGINILLS
ncbi:hypothetical protein BP5796_04919 [Coleophoma crateriformis]|uniref:Zn(2)-C6 fungal-type domain-containing protein n=1 Tax=Coleophoma crateriformis TaxID=565419 RepID=A0A3D8SCD6_9HELO|nr:hypothetical protein BP5796_04919 [Coleophoma crateriformis]